MQESEVIIVDNISDKDYDAMVLAAARYAVISIPFTSNRMQKDELRPRVINIIKGKTGESSLCSFCRSNEIPVDQTRCSTPFYQTDNRDFMLIKCEWDGKNNFLYHSGNLLSGCLYSDLPALIPNNYTNDQWSKRDKHLVEGSNHSVCLFTYMKNRDRFDRQSFFDFNWTEEQEAMMLKASKKYGGNNYETPPFTEEKFWAEYEKRGRPVSVKMNSRPYLVITAYAHSDHWDLFKDSGSGVKKYCGGILTTVINNKECTVNKLPSFLSLFPKLAKFSIGARKEPLQETKTAQTTDSESATLFS